jgi:hypothetical protein
VLLSLQPVIKTKESSVAKNKIRDFKKQFFMTFPFGDLKKTKPFT